MLFDLRGKRRRAVQVTYASLAALMAIGLVGAGIGSDVSGGVFDIFTGDDSGDVSDANKPVQDRIDAANDRLKVNPKDQAALIQVVRGHYALAVSDTNRETGEFGTDGKKELVDAADAWQRYLATEPKNVDPAFASLMLTAFGPLGLNKPQDAVIVADLIADERKNAESYLQLVQFAYLAGDKRKAERAAERALALAPEGERDTVKSFIEQAKAIGEQQEKQQQQQQPPPGGGGTPPGGLPPAPGG
jgi:hypothetical protein